MIAIVFFLLFPLVSFNAYSNETHCFCETGASPSYQIPFFKMGCQLWLSEQSNCSSKKIINRSILANGEFIPTKTTGIEIKMGYVGHWPRYVETMNYLFSYIAPLSQKYNANIELDLTGCSGIMKDDYFFNNPQYNWIFKLPPSKKISIKANQTTSVGVWTMVGAPSSYNLPIKVEIPSGNKLYPKCDNYIGKSCMHKIHKGDVGLCENNNKEKIEIVCCEEKWFSKWAIRVDCKYDKVAHSIAPEQSFKQIHKNVNAEEKLQTQK